MAGLSGLGGLAVVKNEADIIEAMIRHNLHFLDALVVVDNASADQTAQIVAALAQEFPGRLLLSHDPRLGHLEQQILNSLLSELG
ncbi:MAG: glycosyltransferase family 2 protein, partial [Lutimaribacter sp.]